MSDPITRRAATDPNALALWTPEATWTYAEFDAAVTATAQRLAERGVGSGDRVGLRMRRGAGTVVLLWALWRRGAVAAPMSTRWPPGRVAAAGQRAGVETVVTREPAVRAAWEHGSVLDPSALVRPKTEAPRREGEHPPEGAADRDATIVFTSGSTGTPKAALHGLDNHLASAAGSNANIPVAPGDRWLLSLPLYHVGGLAILFRCALGGGAVAVPPRDAAIDEAVRVSGATHLSLVATQARRLLDASAPLPAGVSAILLGGSALPDALVEAAWERDWPVHTTYGCTEMASQVTTTPPGASLETLRTAGMLLPNRRLRIDASGEILLGGDTLFRGYLEDGGDRVSDPRDDDGWYASGDLGRLDADDRLHVEGRVDRMFISGGENVQPEEIEAALERLPGVRRAVVVTVPDDEYGQRPVAFVDATTIDTDRWREALAADLARFKLPDAYHPLPAAAVDGRLKVDREALQEEARKLQG